MNTAQDTLFTLLNNSVTPDESSEIFAVGASTIRSFQIENPGGEAVTIYKSLSPGNNIPEMAWFQHGEVIQEDAWVLMNEAVRFVKVVRGPGTTPVTVRGMAVIESVD